MPTLSESRQDFLRRITSFTNESEHRRFADVLDDFIGWTKAYPDTIEHVDQDYEQKVVSFRELRSGLVLWSAYPREDDGAKLEILPGAYDRLPDGLRQSGVVLFQSLSREPISENTSLRVSFRALKNQARRDQVKVFLGQVLVSLQDRSSEATSQ